MRNRLSYLAPIAQRQYLFRRISFIAGDDLTGQLMYVPRGAPQFRGDIARAAHPLACSTNHCTKGTKMMSEPLKDGVVSPEVKKNKDLDIAEKALFYSTISSAQAEFIEILARQIASALAKPQKRGNLDIGEMPPNARSDDAIDTR
jgi:hypothetical protein